MILTLTKRPAQVGPSINTRTEKHGEEDVPGIDIPIGGIFLQKDELNALLQDLDAHDALYTDSRGAQLEPRFQTLSPFALEDKFTGAKVTIAATTGNQADALVLKPARVGKIRLEPQVGGLTLMTCTVQGNPPDHADVLSLLNQKCRISILNAELEEKGGTPEQPELPIDHQGQGPADGSDAAEELGSDTGEDGEPELSTTGRRIQAAAKKKGRKAKGRRRET